jgi:L-threonylcarbamoyladenylate synthase
MTEASRITEAITVLENGGVLVYPTETVYGIGCDPLNVDACNRIQSIKKRLTPKPFLLLASTIDQVTAFNGELDDVAARLADIFWPGPLTIVMTPTHEIPSHLLGNTGGVAFRVSNHPVATALADGLGRPLISTSANSAGESPLLTYEDTCAQFETIADLILENPAPYHGKPSTVIDLTGRHLAIIREGTISEDRIREVL